MTADRLIDKKFPYLSHVINVMLFLTLIWKHLLMKNHAPLIVSMVQSFWMKILSIDGPDSSCLVEKTAGSAHLVTIL